MECKKDIEDNNAREQNIDVSDTNKRDNQNMRGEEDRGKKVVDNSSSDEDEDNDKNDDNRNNANKKRVKGSIWDAKPDVQK